MIAGPATLCTTDAIAQNIDENCEVMEELSCEAKEQLGFVAQVEITEERVNENHKAKQQCIRDLFTTLSKETKDVLEAIESVGELARQLRSGGLYKSTCEHEELPTKHKTQEASQHGDKETENHQRKDKVKPQEQDEMKGKAQGK